MNLTARITSALAGAFTGFTGKSLATAFARGDDLPAASRSRLTDPFAESAWVHFAVNAIADELSARPLKFYLGDREHTDAALAGWWEQPALGPQTLGSAPRLSRAEVQRDLAGWLSLEGEFFLVFDDAWIVTGGRAPGAALTPFFIARPDRMQFIVRSGVLEGYRYTTVGGRQLLLVPEQVIHRKRFNPYDDWRGVGDLQAALVAAQGAFFTGTYIRDLARNNGDQGFIVVGKSGPATDEQRAQIVADLRAKRAALARGQAKDLFLSGGDFSVERPAQQAASAELTASKSLSHQEVLVAFGVPPSMGEVKAAYSIGKDSDYYQLIVRTCQPRGATIAGAFATIASRQTGKQLTAELDWDDHPVMREVRQARVETGLKLWGTGMPMAAVNDYLDLGLQPYAGWDTGYLPFSVAPVGGTPEPAADPALGEDPETQNPKPETGDEDASVAALRCLLLARRRAAPSPETQNPKPETCGCGCGAAVTRADRDPREVSLWKQHVARRREIAKAYASTFSRLLMQARAETLQKIEAHAAKSAGGVVARAAAADLTFNLPGWKDKFLAALRKVGQSALDSSAQSVLDELNKADDPWKMAPKEVHTFLSERQNRLAGVADDVWQRIRDSIAEGLDSGDTTAQLAARVRTECNGIDAGRAIVVAQTETGAAYGAGRQAAMAGVGVKWKRWLTSGNANVRSAHDAANGQTVPIDEPYVVGGEALMHPGDPEGAPSNVINCHCVSIAVAEGPAD